MTKYMVNPVSVNDVDVTPASLVTDVAPRTDKIIKNLPHL